MNNFNRLQCTVNYSTSNLDCTLDVNVNIGHGSFPEIWVVVDLKIIKERR